MQLQTVKQPGSQLDLTFQLEAQDVQKTFSKVFSELATRGQVPGFRPGKAPAAIIKRRYKPEMLRDMFWMQVVEDYVQKELENEDLEVLGDPEFPDFQEMEVAEDSGVEFTIKVTVRPEPQLPEYAGLKLYRVPAEVTEEQVNEVIEQMRVAASREEAVEGRPVQDGDLVEAEVVVQLEGAETPGEPTSETLEIGGGRYQPAIDQALIGHSAGDTVEIPVDYPEDHEDETLAGQKGVVRATIQSLKVRLLPEVTDDFAQSQGEYDSLEDLRAKLSAKLLGDAQKRSQQNLENDALAAVVRDTVIDMPQSLVQNVAQRNFASFAEELRQAGLTLEQFAEVAGGNLETLAANEFVRAEAGLRVNFVLEALAKVEGIEVGDEAMAEEVALFAAENNMDPDVLSQMLELQPEAQEQIESRASRRLTLAALLAKAEVEDVTAERYTEIKEEERQAREAAAEKARAEAEAAAAAEAAATEETESAQAAAEGEANPEPVADVEEPEAEPEAPAPAPEEEN